MDRLGLDDWHSSSASDSSHDSSGIHLITEEDLLDSLFFTCDVNKNRKVPVSKLIETLKFTTGLTNEDPPHDHLEDLCQLLDPEGRDVHVNLSTYRKAMSHWIQIVRQKNCFESPEEIGDDFPNFFMPERALSPEYDKIVQYLKMPFGSSSPGPINDIIESGETAGTTYLEGSGCGGMEEAPVQEADMVEILNRVTNLQLSNQKLAEENSKLRSERESADDLMLQTNQEVEQLKKTIKSHQVTVDRMCELRKENDDLKEMVESLEALRRASEMKHGDQHKENRTLEQDITELQVELHEVSSQLTVALEEQSSLHSSFVEQKQKRTEAEKLRHLQMTQLLEKSGQLEQLQTIISDLGRKNEYIREEKTNLEQQLTQTQQQLSTMQARVGRLGVVETSDEESDSEDLMPIKLIPVASSTPCHGLSIGFEMKTSIVDDPMLPSPLCDKEFEEMLKECQPGEVERSVDGIALSPSVAQKYGAKAFTATQEFRERKDAILQRVSELSQLVPLYQGALCTGLRKLNDHLKTDMNAFVKEITSQAVAKLAFKKRIKKLIKTLVLLKNQNKQIREMCDNVTQKTIEECDSRVDVISKTVSHLESQCRQQAEYGEQLQLQLNESRQQLAAMMEELVAKTGRVTDSISQALRQQVDELQSTNMELTEKYEKTKEKVTELEEELEASSTECLLEKEKNSQLQDSLTSNCLQRQVDMKELWHLVHSDIDIDTTSTDSQESVMTASTELLREQVVKEMQSLRMQLAKSQMALVSLEARQLPLGFRCSDQSSGYRNNNEDRFNSPLIDALTLDLDHLMRNRVTDRWHQESSSADDFGEDIALSEADSFWEERPELMTPCLLCKVARPVNTATQTDDDRGWRPQLADRRYAMVNTSTGSSTSGIDVSSCSVRSELSSGSVYKSAHITETPRTPDSFNSTDDDQPGMQRTPSFRLAIELSQDLAVQSLDLYDGDSTVTSPDLTPVSTELPAYPDSDDISSCLQCSCQSQSCDCSQVVMSHCEPDATLEPQQCDDYSLNDSTAEQPDVKNRLRKLSTLVEEGSEVDAEELVATAACRKMQCSQKTLPQYKSPPAYETGCSRKSISREALTVESKMSNSGLDGVETPRLVNQSNEWTGDSEQKTEMKRTTRTDLQRTASFEERKGPERESAHGTRDTQHSQLAQAVVEPSKLTSDQTGDIDKRMTQRRITKTDLQRTVSFEMGGGKGGTTEWESHTATRDIQHSPLSSAVTEVPKLRTSHSCTSLERVREMSSDRYCPVFTEAGHTERKLVNDASDVQLSPTQLEDKFCDLALRFKDNKENLEERVKQHKHTRDVTEENISRELAGLNKLLKSMTSNDTEVQGLCTRLRQHISVLEHTSKQLASRSEAHGAVQQELRESSQVNLMIEYVENLKRKYENLKHTHSITAEQSVGARPGMRKQNIKLPRRATVQTISLPTYQEKYSVTGKLLRRAVSCIPSLASKHLVMEVPKEQARMTNGDSGDTGDDGGTVAAGDTLSTTKLESVEEIESQETQASNGSIGDASTATDVNQNSCRMRPVLKRRAMMLFPDSSVPTAVSEASEEPCDDCVTSSQEANMSSSAQRIASWFVPWRWRGTLLQKLRYIFSCLIFMCGIIMFVFVFVPTRKGLKMDSNAQAVEVDDILKSYTSLRHHAAPPV